MTECAAFTLSDARFSTVRNVSVHSRIYKIGRTLKPAYYMNRMGKYPVSLQSIT